MDVGFIISTSRDSVANLQKIKDTISGIVNMYGTDQTRYTAIQLVDSDSVRESDVDIEASRMKQDLPDGVNVTVLRSDGMELVDAIDEAKKMFVKVNYCFSPQIFERNT